MGIYSYTMWKSVALAALVTSSSGCDWVEGGCEKTTEGYCKRVRTCGNRKAWDWSAQCVVNEVCKWTASGACKMLVTECEGNGVGRWYWSAQCTMKDCPARWFWKTTKDPWDWNSLVSGTSVYGGCKAANSIGTYADGSWTLKDMSSQVIVNKHGDDRTRIRIEDTERNGCAFRQSELEVDLHKVKRIDFDVETGCIKGRANCRPLWFAFWLFPEGDEQYKPFGPKPKDKDQMDFGEIDLVEASEDGRYVSFNYAGRNFRHPGTCAQEVWNNVNGLSVKHHVSMFVEGKYAWMRRCAFGSKQCRKTTRSSSRNWIDLSSTRNWQSRKYTFIADMWDLKGTGFFMDVQRIMIV